MNCPHCGSEQTQAVKAMLATQTHVHAGGPHISLSLQAARYPTGPKPTAIWYLVLGGLLAVTGFVLRLLRYELWDSLAGGFGLVLLLAGGVAMIVFKKPRAAWDRAQPYIQGGWICLKCGEDWLPT